MSIGTRNDFAPNIQEQAEALKTDIAEFFNIEIPTRPLPQVYAGSSDSFYTENEALFTSIVSSEVQKTREAWQGVMEELHCNLPLDGASAVRQKELMDFCKEEIVAIGGLYLNTKIGSDAVSNWEERILISNASKAKPEHVLTHELIHFLSSDGEGSTGVKTPAFAKRRNTFNEACTSLLTLCYEIKSTKILELREQLNRVRNGEIFVGYPLHTAQLLLVLQRMEINGVENPVNTLIQNYFRSSEKDMNYLLFLMDIKANVSSTDPDSAKIVEGCCKSLGI